MDRKSRLIVICYLLVGGLLSLAAPPPDRRQDEANALLDYAVKNKGDLEKSTAALEKASWLIGQMRLDSATANEPGVMATYERFLKLAVAPPFNMRHFAYEYGRLLQKQSKFEEAAAMFRLVPDDSKRLIEARYYEMASMKQVLDAIPSKLDDEKRKFLVRRIMERADDVKNAVNAALNHALDDDIRARYRAINVNTTLIAADVARKEMKDYDRVLKLLDGFENSTVGVSNETEVNGSALFQRVQAYIAQGKHVKATDELVKLLKTDPRAGQGIIYTLLTRLNEDLDRATKAGDKSRMRDLANSRAVLSGFMIEWMTNSSNPELKKNLYLYMRFDASAKAQAAESQENPEKRLRALREARDLYKSLRPPANVVAQYDPVVVLHVGLLSYDIGEMGHDLADYREAQVNLGRLLYDHKVGGPESDQYWDLLYKLFKSNLMLGKIRPELIKETKEALAQVIIKNGDNVGGKRLKAEFAQLRKQLLPDLEAARATTRPVTNPK